MPGDYYWPHTADIWLHAYVYDPERLPLPLPLCELFLRLRALTTFAHELAHHFDHSRRVARGRWLARGRNRLERYWPHTADIWLHAYVYDPERLPLPLPLCELFLRLRALTTFAHELAHHFDHSRRVARGRWLARGRNRLERYAEGREYSWGQEFVVPLLRRRYPAQVRALEEWVAHHGGVRVPMELLAGDPRTTRKDGLINMCSDAGAAFTSWLDEVARHRDDLFASRFAFAQQLHWADQYDLCLETLEGLLAGWPPTPKTWTFKADTLVHLERWDEAEVCARRALAQDDALLDAWTQLGWVAIGRHDWQETLGPVHTSEISPEMAVLEIPEATKRPILMFRKQIFDHLSERFQRTCPKC